HEQIGDVADPVGNNCSNSNSTAEVNQTGQWMNVSIEVRLLALVAIEHDGLAQTQGHRRLGVLSVALLLPLAVDQDLRTLDHKALDEPLVLMAPCGAHGGIKISEMQSLEFHVLENLLARVRHVPKVLAGSHARRDVDVEVVYH